MMCYCLEDGRNRARLYRWWQVLSEARFCKEALRDLTTW